MPEVAVGAAVRGGVALERALAVTMPWGSAGAALLGFAADFGGVAVLLAIKALGEPAIAVVELAVFELAVKEQPVVNQ
jgi:hypothetical protein